MFSAKAGLETPADETGFERYLHRCCKVAHSSAQDIYLQEIFEHGIFHGIPI